MKKKHILFPILSVAAIFIAGGCDDDVSRIGSTISSSEIKIRIDSAEYNLHARCIDSKEFDARSGTLLIGNLNLPEYGKLDCSFVTRLMPISQFPDSMTVSKDVFNGFVERIDSCAVQLFLSRGNFTGDSLAPQKATVYLLEKQIPSSINNAFNPAGYYNPASPLGSKCYTVSNAGASDNAVATARFFQMRIPVDKQFAVDIFRKYESDPQAFAWPQDFAKFIPGLYVENTFGKGCVANYSSLTVNAYYHTTALRDKTDEEGNRVKDEDGNVIQEPYLRADSLVLCSTAPEVLSSNRINFRPSDKLKQMVADGKTVITTPGGFSAQITFPAEELIGKFNAETSKLAIVSDLTMTIPAQAIDNNIGMTGAPYLLMVRTSQLEKFFAGNSIPDNRTSFYAQYNSTIGGYRFTGLREYILDLIKKESLEQDDIDFSLVPVMVYTESTESSYYSAGVTYVTGCVPYMARPTMMTLDTDKTQIVFTFSSQMIE